MLHSALKLTAQNNLAHFEQGLNDQLWIKRYREKGLAGLANATRSDKGKPRSLPKQAITLPKSAIRLRLSAKSLPERRTPSTAITSECRNWPLSFVRPT